jgi:predicted nucleic acid-binding protein
VGEQSARQARAEATPQRVTLVLDSGAVSALANQPARLAEFRRAGEWPPQVPSIVLTEALTGDHRRDYHRNQLLAMCQIRPVTEELARKGAKLRGAVARPDTIAATDAIVAALATTYDDAVVLTGDVEDLSALLEGEAVTVARV